ncbi:MAG: hypothetical protein WCJ15_03250 [Alphaproteobacteria bacterium]
MPKVAFVKAAASLFNFWFLSSATCSGSASVHADFSMAMPVAQREDILTLE